MAEITAAMVKELRESTGAGMLDCKKALVEANGNMEEAVSRVKELPGASIWQIRENEIVLSCSGEDDQINRIVMSLMKAGVMIGGFRKEEQSLETLFMQLTEGSAATVNPGAGNMQGRM